MKKYKFKIGDIVKVTYGGVTYPFLKDLFLKLEFKNKQINNWKWYDYTTCPLLFRIDKIVHNYNATYLYKITCITDSNLEYLIEEQGVEFVTNNKLTKIKII